MAILVFVFSNCPSFSSASLIQTFKIQISQGFSEHFVTAQHKKNFLYSPLSFTLITRETALNTATTVTAIVAPTQTLQQVQHPITTA